jgi:hypothetical protein
MRDTRDRESPDWWGRMEWPRNLPFALVATEALMRAVLALFEKVVQLNRNLPDDAYVAAMNVEEPGWLADLVASMLDL